eukprot:g2014.t1
MDGRSSVSQSSTLGGVPRIPPFVIYIVLGIIYLIMSGTKVTTILSIAVAGVAAAVGLIYVQQDNLIYPRAVAQIPRSLKENPKGFRSPAEWRVPMPYEDVTLVAPSAEKEGTSVKLSAWLIKAVKNPSLRPTILHLHGNAGNIGFRLEFYEDLWTRCNVNILALDYRGYGDSQGEPSQEGLVLDALAALQYLHERPDINSNAIYCLGRSLGGAVAIHTAERILLGESSEQETSQTNNAGKTKSPTSQPKLKLAGLILDNTFLSIAEMGVLLLPLLKLPGIRHAVPYLLRSPWNSKEKMLKLANQTNIPMLFLSGSRDELIPPAHMHALYNIAKTGTYTPPLDQAERGTPTTSGHASQTTTSEQGSEPTSRPYRNLVTIRNGHHNDTPKADPRTYYNAVRDFLQKTTRSS